MSRRSTRRSLALMVTTAMLLVGSPVFGSETPGSYVSDHAAVMSEDGVPMVVRTQFESRFWVETPCGRVGVLAGAHPIEGVEVVLDPGHGGARDTGAVAPTGLIERDINLAVAEAAKTELERRGIGTALTRTADYASRLAMRARLAEALEPQFMLSIHHNAPSGSRSLVPGVEVFVQKDDLASKRLGGLIWEEAMEHLSQFPVDWVTAADAGVMTVLNTRGNDAYGILRHPSIPTALVELGYISNRSEAELFATAEYLDAASSALADAVERFLATDEEGSGFGEGRVFDPNPGLSGSRCIDPDAEGLTTLRQMSALFQERRQHRSDVPAAE